MNTPGNPNDKENLEGQISKLFEQVSEDEVQPSPPFLKNTVRRMRVELAKKSEGLEQDNENIIPKFWKWLGWGVATAIAGVGIQFAVQS